MGNQVCRGVVGGKGREGPEALNRQRFHADIHTGPAGLESNDGYRQKNHDSDLLHVGGQREATRRQ